MPAELLLEERYVVAENAFAGLLIWRIPSPLPGSAHDLKYRLAFVVDGQCVLRYDNESGKGDHKHLDDEEHPYRLTTPAQLIEDFWSDVDELRP